ncbi:MAG: SGNH/GDSL hydrolase family protein [Balneolaceae bacterium]|nr:SGNH/GDSL hydrolase family protein [Balneolaceae bacterium]
MENSRDMGNTYTRRRFLEQITTATVSALGTGSILTGLAPGVPNQPQQVDIPQDAIILFQGDSITDAHRDKDDSDANDPDALGRGYAFLAAASLRHSMPRKNLTCYNRGISGNKVFQLAERWQEDCLDLQPDLVSILIGVNDFWHTLDYDYDGTVEIYESDFRELLQRTRRELPDVQLIIGEPFVIEEGSAVDERWFPRFPEYQAAARRIADEFNAAFIPYQQVFDEASKQVAPTYWSGDGVHPSMAGAQLMAQAWLETFRRL